MNKNEIIKGFPNTFPQLETERLTLRKLSINDLKPFYQNFADPEVVKFFMEPMQEEKEAEEWLSKMINHYQEKRRIYWVLELKESKRYIGTVSFEQITENETIELGYDLSRDMWGNGYVTEALKEVMKYGSKQFNLSKFEAFTNIDNKRSVNLLEKLAFIHKVTDEENWGHFVKVV